MSRDPVRKALNKWSRKVHRWLTIALGVPILVILASGVVLQLKKDVDWIQPPTQRGSADTPTLSFDDILAAARAVPEADIDSWADVDRLDVRPTRGVIKIRADNRYEIQIDAHTADVLSVAYRRSDLIEAIHDGSFFHDAAKLWIFLPAGVALLALWLTGVYLWWMPHGARRARAKRAAAAPGPGLNRQ